ncbi:MAG: phosphatase PAP2 family protein [Pseudomonadota bacterium]
MKPNRRRRVVAACFAEPATWRLAAAAAVAILPLMLFVDRPLAEAMEQLPVELRNLAGDVTSLGKSLGWLLLSAALAILFAWRARAPNLPARRRWSMRWRAQAAAFVFAAVALSGIVTDLIKLAVGRLRPNMLLQDGLYGFDPWHMDSDFRGFPSGHATTVFALALALGWIAPRWRWPAFIFALLIAATRIVINAHFLSDVVGGALVALLTALWLRQSFARRGWVFRACDGRYRLSGLGHAARGDQKPRTAP